MDLLQEAYERVFITDGAMGTLMQQEGLVKEGECAHYLNVTHPAEIAALHKKYVDAGSDIVLTTTFGTSKKKLANYNLQDKQGEIIKAAVQNAKNSGALVGLDIGPLGEYMEPIGKLSFDEVYEQFADQMQYYEGADMIFIETLADMKSARVAVIAAKETCDLPIVCSMTFEDQGRSVLGTDPKTAAVILTSLGVDIIGSNCGAGSDLMKEIGDNLRKGTNLPISLKPNAGLPQLVDGKTIFPETPEDMARFAEIYAESGFAFLGGCCGSTPAHLAAIAKAVKGKKPNVQKKQYVCTLASRTKTQTIDDFTVIGERINPTGRKNLQEELKQNSTSLIRKDAVAQVKEGAQVLDVNVSMVGTDNKVLLMQAVDAIQGTTNAPLSIDTPDLEALEAALKKSDGKPLINSTTGERDKMEKVFSLAKKYGAAVIGLTIDENGMPKTADERFEIAKKIIEFGSKYIPKEDILIDCLTRTVSAEQGQAQETLNAVKRIKEELGVKTLLGVSNISHGLPNRPLLNAAFLKLAKENGLDSAIYNPSQLQVSSSELAEKVLTGEDAGASEYIKSHVDFTEAEEKPKELTLEERLKWDIVEGNDEDIVPAVDTALTSRMDSVQVSELLISALRSVGEKFNNREVFLPQVMSSASAMKKALARLKQELSSGEGVKGTVLFATVKNDMHDIGKGIVIALLEANNYKVIDLGVDIDASVIVEKAKETNPDVIALSALMTTTVVNVPKVIEELKKNNINTPVMIGGAVVTEDYANSIGATYSKDAIGAADLLSKLLSKP